MKKMEEYTTVELKSMGFDVSRQIALLRDVNQKIHQELIKRKAIEQNVEVTPDAESEPERDIEDNKDGE